MHYKYNSGCCVNKSCVDVAFTFPIIYFPSPVSCHILCHIFCITNFPSPVQHNFFGISYYSCHLFHINYLASLIFHHLYHGTCCISPIWHHLFPMMHVALPIFYRLFHVNYLMYAQLIQNDKSIFASMTYVDFRTIVYFFHYFVVVAIIHLFAHFPVHNIYL